MEEKRIYYDFTHSQKMMHYTLKYFPKKNIVNIGVSIWFNEKVKTDALEASILLAIERIDALRIRIKKVHKEDKQYVSNEQKSAIKIIDLQDKTEEDVEEYLLKLTAKGYKYKDCDLYDVFMIKWKENKSILYLRVNHLIMDAWGVMVLGRNILENYCSIVDDKDLLPMPGKFTNVIEEELKYNGGDKEKEDKEYWENRYTIEPKFTSINRKDVGKRYRTPSLFYKAKQEVYILDKDLAEGIKAFCYKNRISPQVIFLLAVHNYLAKINNYNEATILNSVARRNSVESKISGGMMVSAVPFRLDIDQDMTFIEACEYIYDEQNSIFRHSDYPYQNISDYLNKKFQHGKKLIGNYSDVCFTYQAGNIKLSKDLDYKIKWHNNGCLGMGLYITIMDAIAKGVLEINFHYNTNICNVEIIKELYKHIIDFISIGIKNEFKTLNEINNNKEELNIISAVL